MKIGTKITLGFSSVLALTAIVGTIGWVGLDGYASGVGKAQGMSDLVVDLRRLPLRISEFESGDNQTGLTEAQEIMDEALQSVERIAEAEKTLSVTTMGRELRAYREALLRYGDLHEQNRRQQAKMTETGKAIDLMTNQIYTHSQDRYVSGLQVLEELERQSELRFTFVEGANSLVRATLAARRAEAEYQLDPNPEAREQAASFMKQIYLSNLSLKKVAKAAGEETDVVKALSSEVKAYRKHFGAFIEAVDDGLDVGPAKTALVDASEKVQSLAEGIAGRQRQAFTTIAEQAQSARGKVRNAFAVATQAMTLGNAILELHAVEKTFFQRRDPAMSNQVGSLINGVETRLTELAESTEEDKALVQETLDLLPTYRATFATASAASLGQGDALAAMRAQETSVFELAEHNAAEAVADMSSLYDVGHLTLAVFCTIALFGGAAISVLTGRSIARPIKSLTSSISDLANGNGAVIIPELDRADEIGDMARSMGIIRETGITAIRAQKTLENTAACLMMVDDKGCVAYVNPAFQNLVANAQHAVSAELPGFAAAAFIGQPFNDFHNDPSIQSEQLLQLTEPSDAMISAAGFSFDLKLNPIFDLRGVPIGTVVSWRDRTTQIRLEAEVEALIDAATSGNLEGRLATDHVDGFMLTLCQGMNRLMETVEGGVKSAGKVIAALAAGNLTCEMAGNYQGIFKELQNDSNRMRAELSSIATNIIGASDALSDAVKEIASGTSDLTSRTQSQSSYVEQTSSSMSDLTETVKSNTEGAMEANKIAQKTRAAADSGHQVVGEATKAMEGIQTAATKITDIVNMIDEIAFQTNLLALNASVEAARAGEAGKGFAVVASEVRALAQRSGDASAQIKTLIEETVSEIGGGVSLVQEVGSGLQDIVGSVNALADLVVEITEAGQEQSTKLADVSKAVSAMGGMADQNASLAEQTMAAVRSQGQQVGELDRLVRFFKTENDKARAA